MKTLKLQSFENIDTCPGPDEHLGSCPTLEELYLEQCQVRDKESTKALFLVCESVREISFLDCWGFEDDLFRFAAICRYEIGFCWLCFCVMLNILLCLIIVLQN